MHIYIILQALFTFREEHDYNIEAVNYIREMYDVVNKTVEDIISDPSTKPEGRLQVPQTI